MGATIAQVLAQAKQCIDSLDAEVLLAHLLECNRTYLLAHPEESLSPTLLPYFNEWVTRRKNGEPIAYITGEREFWSLNLQVSVATLIPRPETEMLVECILKDYPADSTLKVADMGTGCGAIAVALAKERPSWQIVATDISQNALRIARKNAQRLGLENISFFVGNWCTALPIFDFDVIVSNPPYIAENEWHRYHAGLMYEPKGALVSGPDGLAAIRVICAEAGKYLRPNGCLALEHGFDQGQLVRKCLELNGFSRIETLQDLAGLERVTKAIALKSLSQNRFVLADS